MITEINATVMIISKCPYYDVNMSCTILSAEKGFMR